MRPPRTPAVAVAAAAAVAVAVAAAAVALGACGGPSRAAPPPAAPPPAAPAVVLDEEGARELADGVLEVLDGMAAIVELHARACVEDEAACATTCARIAADLGALFDQAEPLFALARDAAADPASKRRIAEALDRHAAEVAPRAETIDRGLAACAREPALIEVMERMPVL